MKKRVGVFGTPLRILLTVVLLLGLAGLGSWLYLQGKDIPVFNPQGSVGVQQKQLIIFTLLLSVIVIVPVYVMLIAFAWRYREANGHKAAYTPDVEGNRWIEAIWWGVPIAIMCVLGTVTWITTHQLDPYKPLDSKVPALRVQVVALQWRWLFLYPDQHAASINELRIPANTPINFEITADAPMSAFWIPSLGTQTYAMTGMTSRLSLIADRPGVLRGTNTNINGKGYSNMDFKVDVLKSRREFDFWTRAIANLPEHSHLEWSTYEKLAKPSESTNSAYYHLHDTDLFDQILNKYMPDGHDYDAGGGHSHAAGGAH